METIARQRKRLVARTLAPGLVTLGQVRRVRREALACLEKHPHDREVLANGESLVMLAQALAVEGS